MLIMRKIPNNTEMAYVESKSYLIPLQPITIVGIGIDSTKTFPMHLLTFVYNSQIHSFTLDILD